MINSSISNVNKLIHKRDILNTEIADSIQNLSLLGSNLSILASNNINNNAQPGNTVETNNGLQYASIFQELIVEIDKEQRQLEKLQSRFGKRDITIGVVGKARQGKSAILQSLSGLDNDIIPSGNGLHCTAVTSHISNTEKKGLEIFVKLYNRDKFFTNIILPYYENLGISPVPKSIVEFASSSIPELKNWDDANSLSKYKRLVELHMNFSEYYPLLTGLSKSIPQEEISNFVTYQSQDKRTSYKSLAVESVKINCRFPYPGLGNITLVDMPGIGDVSLNDEQIRIKELVSKVDFLMFIRKPDSLGDVWDGSDLELYNACNEAVMSLGLPGVTVADNAFLVLNRVDLNAQNNNLHICTDLKESLAKNGMKFSDVAIIDCTDTNEVNDKILGNLGTSFINKISQLDNNLMAFSRQKIAIISKKVNQISKKLESMEESDYNQDLYLFKNLFNGLWNAQTNAFENLLKHKYTLSSDPNELVYNHFLNTKKYIKQLLNDLTVDDIRLSRNAVGSYNKAYEEYLNEYKTQLNIEFLKLDGILLEVLDSLKDEVYTILKTEGKLACLHSMENDFSSILINEVRSIGFLNKTISSFVNFQLSYLGYLHFKIREHMDILTPDFTQIRLSRTDSAEDILSYVRHSVEACLYQIQKEFEIWSTDINKITYGVLEEFLNQIFRSNQAKDNWEIFYQMNRVKVWSDRYGKLNEKQNQLAILRSYMDSSKKLSSEKILNTYE